MRFFYILILFLSSFGLNSQQSFQGFFNFQYNGEGKIILDIPSSQVDQEFIYINSLSAGVGSNDIGLDRGQLGKSRIVKFIKAGNKILLVEPNYSESYRKAEQECLP